MQGEKERPRKRASRPTKALGEGTESLGEEQSMPSWITGGRWVLCINLMEGFSI